MVLKSGDLTEEQAKQAEKEAATKPREATNEKIVFKRPKKTDDSETKDNGKSRKSAKKIKNKSLLSFTEEDDG